MYCNILYCTVFKYIVDSRTPGTNSGTHGVHRPWGNRGAWGSGETWEEEEDEEKDVGGGG